MKFFGVDFSPESLKIVNPKADAIFAYLFIASVPFISGIAYYGELGYFNNEICSIDSQPIYVTGSWELAFFLSSFLSIGSWWISQSLSHTGWGATYNAVVSQVLCALVMHFGGGSGEAHFPFFVFISFLVIYRHWWPIVLACTVIGSHHIFFYVMQNVGLPVILFSCLSFGTLAVHVSVAVVQTAMLCYIAFLMVKELRTSEQLQQNASVQQQRLDMALQGANAGLWDWNVPTGEVITGDTWNTMLGYSAEELDERYGNTPDRLEKLVHPDDLPGVLREMRNHIDGVTEVLKTEFRMLTADGHWKWILDIGRASERDANGKGTRVVGIHLDIDDTKNLEAEILKAKTAAEETTKELQVKLEEQERFERLVVGRELKMIELKKEVNQLLEDNGQNKKYKTENSE